MKYEDKVLTIPIAQQAEFALHERYPEISSDKFYKFVKLMKQVCAETYRNQIALCFQVDFALHPDRAVAHLRESVNDLVEAQSRKGHSAKVVALIDIDGGLHSVKISEWEGRVPDDLWAAKISELTGSIVVHVHGKSLHIYDHGVPVERWNDIFRRTYPFAPITKQRPAREYRELVESHFHDCIVDQLAVHYWVNKAKRILRDKPEAIFHHNLWWYLKENVLDGIVDRERQVDGRSDEADIWITTVSGEEFLMEVKWLGKSELHEYKEERAHEGAKQLRIYLGEFPQVTRAGLILYDARETDRPILYSAEEEHPKADLDLRFWLPSESASQAARRKGTR